MLISIVEKYSIPLFQAPDSGSAGVPGDAGGNPSASAGVGSSGLPASGSSGPSGSPGQVSDASGSEDTFVLSDDVMGAGDLDEFVESQPTSGSPQGAAPQTTEAQPQPAQPTGQRPVQQQPQQQAQPTAQPPQTGTTGRPASEPLSPERALGQLLQHRDALVGELASKRFQLSRQDQEAMESNALDHIPKLLARTYFDAFTSSVNFINQQVPQMIQSALSEAKLDQDAETSFYNAWPGLDRVKHGADVLGYANAFRQMNPNASLEDAVKFVGAAVATKYGVANANVRPTQNGQTAQRGNGRRSPPFAPGMGGRAAPQGSQAVEENPFAGMGLVFD